MPRIVIPAMSNVCPAALALRAEGQLPDVVIMNSDFSYGEMLFNLWRQGKTFVNVEHDVVAWPGAIDSMLDCDRSFCGFLYSLGRRFGGTLGCVKFSAELMAAVSNTSHWQATPWSSLDDVVFESILKATGLSNFHIHTPPVAHLHDYMQPERRLFNPL